MEIPQIKKGNGEERRFEIRLSIRTKSIVSLTCCQTMTNKYYTLNEIILQIDIFKAIIF